MSGYSAPPAVHSSLDRITEAETIIVTSQTDVLRRNHGTRPGPGVGQPSARLAQGSCPGLLLLQERTRRVISHGSPRARGLAPIPALT